MNPVLKSISAALACGFAALLPPPAAEEAATLKEVTLTAKRSADDECHPAANQKTVIDRAEIDAMGGLGITRDARDLPEYQLSLVLDNSLPWWQACAGFQLNLYGRTRTDIPGELGGTLTSRALLDLFATLFLDTQEQGQHSFLVSLEGKW
jgi:hypothetical protein